MAQKLNQVLAVERNTKQRANSALTQLHRAATKPALFNGFSKVYESLSEDGDSFPPEQQRVQMNATETIRQVENILSELFDSTATKDKANQSAQADLVVDGETLVEGVPATTLLFLEKQLVDLTTFVSKIPTLDPAHEWSFDEAVSLWKTSATKTTKTKKVAKPIVLYPATEQHPAQTQLVQEDVTVGHWNKVNHSGAIPSSRRDEILGRIEKLQKAVKYAREAANQQPAPEQTLSGKVFGYLFS